MDPVAGPSPFPLPGFAVRCADFLAGSMAFPQGITVERATPAGEG